mmetsp:Transcript_24333/g.48429  ORF Transcript_24333/g.48429 Transcript_24333/m.48429 type:complete len:285 (-) Transcript_24333:227-1081(-)
MSVMLNPELHFPQRRRKHPSTEGWCRHVVHDQEVALPKLLGERNAQSELPHLCIKLGGVVLYPTLRSVGFRSPPPVRRTFMPRPRGAGALLRPHLRAASPLGRDRSRYRVYTLSTLFVAVIDYTAVQNIGPGIVQTEDSLREIERRIPWVRVKEGRDEGYYQPAGEGGCHVGHGSHSSRDIDKALIRLLKNGYILFVVIFLIRFFKILFRNRSGCGHGVWMYQDFGSVRKLLRQSRRRSTHCIRCRCTPTPLFSGKGGCVKVGRGEGPRINLKIWGGDGWDQDV